MFFLFTSNVQDPARCLAHNRHLQGLLNEKMFLSPIPIYDHAFFIFYAAQNTSLQMVGIINAFLGGTR